MAARFVLDASVAMAWCFQDCDDGYADAVLERLRIDEGVVPSIWPLEVGNVLLVAERRSRIGEADSARFLALLGALPITVEQEPPLHMLREIVALARQHTLTTYDAAYLALAMRLALPLATYDVALSKAATICRVPAYDPTSNSDQS